MKDLRGKNALLTGASRGIGGHIALALAERGVNLALVARSVDGLEKVKEKVEARGVKAVTFAADIGRLEGLGRLVEQSTKMLGPLDLLVNNAGIVPKGRFWEIALEENDQIIKVNLLAPMQLAHLVIPGMIARGEGHILNMASLAGLMGMAYEEAYTTSKHGLVGFSRSLRSTMQAEGYPIGVSAVCPGFVSEAGMFFDSVEGSDIKVPSYLGTASPQEVAAACVDAIERNRAEVIVSSPPQRPMLALNVFSPATIEWAAKKLGFLNWARVMMETAFAARSRENRQNEAREKAPA